MHILEEWRIRDLDALLLIDGLCGVLDSTLDRVAQLERTVAELTAPVRSDD